MAVFEPNVVTCASLGYVRLHYDWNWQEAEKQFKRAIELNPRYPTAHHWYSHYLMTVGQPQTSLIESNLYLELDPLDLVANGHLRWHYYYAHEFDRLIEVCRDKLAIDPDWFWLHFELGRAYEQKKMFKEAIVEQVRCLLHSRIWHAFAVSGQVRPKMRSKFSAISRSSPINGMSHRLILRSSMQVRP